MRVLVTWGSKRGGTEGLARTVADALRDEGVEVDLLPPREAARARDFDAAIVGGALYANRWHRAARRFVNRRERDLRRVPVWFFSSGPLDDSSARDAIPPTRQVQALMERVGARGHATFGGTLAPDAKTPLAKEHAGDFRDPARVRAWATAIARELPDASPGVITPQPERSVVRLIAHGVAGWALSAGVFGLALALASVGTARVLHAIFAPLIFVAVARSYFLPRGARAPVPTALAFTAIVLALHALVLAGGFGIGFAVFGSFAALWVPLALIFLATWGTGELMSTLPWSAPSPAGAR